MQLESGFSSSQVQHQISHTKGPLQGYMFFGPPILGEFFMWKLLICLFELEKLYLEVSGTPNVRMVAPPIWHYEAHLHISKQVVSQTYKV